MSFWPPRIGPRVAGEEAKGAGSQIQKSTEPDESAKYIKDLLESVIKNRGGISYTIVDEMKINNSQFFPCAVDGLQRVKENYGYLK